MCKYCDEYNQFRAEQELGMPPEFAGLPYCYTDQVQTRIRQKELRAFAEIAERHGGFNGVHVDTIIEHREDFKALRAYATVHIRSDNSNARDCQIIEGYIQCSSLGELAAISNMMLVGYAVAINRENLEILEIASY